MRVVDALRIILFALFIVGAVHYGALSVDQVRAAYGVTQ